MLNYGILNPQINALLGRVRHTNTLVIADKGFPFWPGIETIDISLCDDIPCVLDVLRLIKPCFQIGCCRMATQFRAVNDEIRVNKLISVLKGTDLLFLPHDDLKQLVPGAIGLIRTGDTTQYANIILESA